MRQKRIYLYLIIIVVELAQFCIEIVDTSLNDVYSVFFTYIFISLIYAPIYLYMLMNRIVHFTNSLVIIRLRKKGDILVLESYENAVQAIEMAIITNIIAAVFMVIILKGRIETGALLYLIFCNILAQSFAWMFVGYIYILLINLTDKAILSFIISVLVVCFIFFSQSGTFTFRNWFINLYSQMVINTDDMKVYDILTNIGKSIFEGLVLCAAAYAVIMRKQIFGNVTGNETDS